MGPQKSVAKIRSLPYVFTEQGVAMLATIIKTDVAVAVSIRIMDAFVSIRKVMNLNWTIIEKVSNIEHKLLDYDKKFEEIFNKFELKEDLKQHIFFEGQIWDSYNGIITIIKRARNKIVIIDNYIDDSILEMLSKKKKGVEAIIITSNNSNILKLDVQKFNKEYPILKITKTDKFHDRFILVDNKELYHCGASLKDLGKKCFGINKIEDDDYIKSLRKNVNF